MIVAKFGGTSVADHTSIEQVLNIVQSNKTKQVIVVSAFGGITNAIHEAAHMAANGNSDYQKIIDQIEKRHISTTKALIPVQSQSSVLSRVKQQINA